MKSCISCNQTAEFQIKNVDFCKICFVVKLESKVMKLFKRTNNESLLLLLHDNIYSQILVHILGKNMIKEKKVTIIACLVKDCLDSGYEVRFAKLATILERSDFFTEALKIKSEFFEQSNRQNTDSNNEFETHKIGHNVNEENFNNAATLDRCLLNLEDKNSGFFAKKENYTENLTSPIDACQEKGIEKSQKTVANAYRTAANQLSDKTEAKEYICELSKINEDIIGSKPHISRKCDSSEIYECKESNTENNLVEKSPDNQKPLFGFFDCFELENDCAFSAYSSDIPLQIVQDYTYSKNVSLDLSHELFIYHLFGKTQITAEMQKIINILHYFASLHPIKKCITAEHIDLIASSSIDFIINGQPHLSINYAAGKFADHKILRPFGLITSDELEKYAIIVFDYMPKKEKKSFMRKFIDGLQSTNYSTANNILSTLNKFIV